MSTQNKRSEKAQIIWNSTDSNSVTPSMVGSLFYDINVEKLERANSNAVYQTYDASYTKIAAINPTTKKMTLIDIPSGSGSGDLSNYYTKNEVNTNLSTKLDKGTYTGTAQSLKNEIDSKQKLLSSFDESILVETDGNIEGNISFSIKKIGRAHV